jgi:hypothetical protein
MSKSFNTLRKKMSPPAQKAATEKTQKMLKKMSSGRKVHFAFFSRYS